MTVSHVFYFKTPYDDAYVCNHHKHNKQFAWRRMVDMLDGDIPMDRSFIRSFDFKLSGRHKNRKTDVVTFPMRTNLAVSDRAKAVITGLNLDGIDFIDVTIEGVVRHLLIVNKEIDCLDKQKSVWLPSPTNPTRAIMIDRYEFLKHKIPDISIFFLSDGGAYLFTTEHVKKAFEDAGLRGFSFLEIEGRSTAAAVGLTPK